jgi:hypothetical protein
MPWGMSCKTVINFTIHSFRLSLSLQWPDVDCHGYPVICPVSRALPFMRYIGIWISGDVAALKDSAAYLSSIPPYPAVPPVFPPLVTAVSFSRFFRYNTMYTLLYFWYYIFVKNKYLRYLCQTYLWMSYRAFLTGHSLPNTSYYLFYLKNQLKGFIYISIRSYLIKR